MRPVTEKAQAPRRGAWAFSIAVVCLVVLGAALFVLRPGQAHVDAPESEDVEEPREVAVDKGVSRAGAPSFLVEGREASAPGQDVTARSGKRIKVSPAGVYDVSMGGVRMFTNDQGEAVFQDLAPNIYRLRVSQISRSRGCELRGGVGMSFEVEVDGDEEDVTAVQIPAQSSVLVQFTGDPPEELDFQVEQQEGTTRARRNCTANTSAPVEVAGLIPGDVRFSGALFDAVSVAVESSPGERARVIEIEIDNPGVSVSGVVTAGQTPLGGAVVVLAPGTGPVETVNREGQTTAGVASQVADPTGRFRFAALAPGDYVLEAFLDVAEARRGMTKRASKLEILESMTVELKIDRRRRSLRGRFADPNGVVDGLVVSVLFGADSADDTSSIGRGTVRDVTDSEGRFEFEVIEGDRVEVVVAKDDGQAVAKSGVITVSEDIELELRAGDAP